MDGVGRPLERGAGKMAKRLPIWRTPATHPELPALARRTTLAVSGNPPPTLLSGIPETRKEHA